MPGDIMPTFNQPQAVNPIPQAIPTYPSPYGNTQGGSAGGLVNKASIIQAGVQNGINQSQQIQKNVRDTKAYDEQQASAKGNAAAANLPGADPAVAHAGFMDALKGAFTHFMTPQGIPAPAPAAGPPAMEEGGPVTDTYKKSTGWDLAKQAVKEIGNAIGGSGAGVRAADASRMAVNGASAKAEGMMDGGPVTSMGVNPQFQRGPATVSPDAVLPMMTGGSVPGMSVVGGATNGVPGFEQGGAIPTYPAPGGTAQQGDAGGLVNTSGIVQAGVQNGINQSQQINQNQRDQSAFDQSQASNRGIAAAATMPPEVAQQHLAATIDSLHQDMHDHSLNDDGVANHSAAPPQGIAAPTVDNAKSTPEAVAAVAADPTAQAGKVTTSPSAEGKPHSIQPEQWQKWDDNIDKAVSLAALAGHDPGQVRASLEANRNAFIQGHVLRNLSVANTALLNGDQAGVEKALKNAYYYMPDGNELSIKKQDGQLVYQDPINPKTADGKPNMIPVDASHIQMLGQAMLDPMNVNTTIMNVRSAQAKIALEQSQAKAAENTGLGNLYKGLGINATGQSHLKLVSSQAFKNLAEGDAARIKANAFAFHMQNVARQNHIDPTLIRGAVEASTSAEKAIQGALTTVPLQVPDPKHPGQMMDNSLNPNAGKPTRDPSQTALPNATPGEINDAKGLAGKIFMGSGGATAPDEAARIALLAIEGRRKGATHPENGKPVQNFHTDEKTGDSWAWDKRTNKWVPFKLPLTSASDAITGNLGVREGDIDQAAMAYMSEGQGGGGAPSTAMAQPEANTPDMEPMNIPAES